MFSHGIVYLLQCHKRKISDEIPQVGWRRNQDHIILPPSALGPIYKGNEFIFIPTRIHTRSDADIAYMYIGMPITITRMGLNIMHNMPTIHMMCIAQATG